VIEAVGKSWRNPNLCEIFFFKPVTTERGVKKKGRGAQPQSWAEAKGKRGRG